MQKGQGREESTADSEVKFKASDIARTQAAQANNYFAGVKKVEEPVASAKPAPTAVRQKSGLNPKRIIIIVASLVLLIGVVIGVVWLVRSLNAPDAGSGTDTDTETAHVLSDAELPDYYVDSALTADSIILTFDEKIAAATNDEEKADLHMQRASYLAAYAASEEGASYRETALADARAAEDYLHNADTATLIMNLAGLFDDQALYSEWQAIVVERNPNFLNGAG